MKTKTKGFTLIELLVTIAIISLLASIVFASVSSARDKANVVTAKAQGKEIEKAFELSRLSNNILPINIGIDESITDLVLSGNSPTVIAAIEESLSSVPSLPSSVINEGGISSGSNDYYYLSDGDYASNGNTYFRCGAPTENDYQPDDYVVFFKAPQDTELNNKFERVYQHETMFEGWQTGPDFYSIPLTFGTPSLDIINGVDYWSEMWIFDNTCSPDDYNIPHESNPCAINYYCIN